MVAKPKICLEEIRESQKGEGKVVGGGGSESRASVGGVGQEEVRF